MPDMRVPGLRGRQPVKPPGQRFAIQYLSDYLTTPLPAPAYPVNVTGGITEWDMLGNGPDKTCTTHPNGVGDCTFAGRQHNRMAKAAAGQEVEKWETSNELVAEYLAYDHGQDQGAQIADLLLYWYKAKKILAFAPVDHTKPTAVDAAMTAFHGAYCVAPSTRILTADLQWTEAGDIPEGEALLGFDERGPRRKWRRSVVTRAQRVMKPCYDLTFSDGTTVRCSADHQWLRSGKASYGQDRITWIRADEMRVGSTRGTVVLKPLDVWSAEQTYAAGYLAAAFDGEGSFRQRQFIYDGSVNRSETELTFAQRDNEMLAQVAKFLKEYDFPAGIKNTNGGTNRNVCHIGIYHRAEIIRFMGSIRPLRLLEKFQPDLLGLLPMTRRVMLVNRVDVGLQEVVALTTTTGTFLAEGLASHNCGVNLTDDADQLFGEREPWTVAGGQQPDPNDGHCIVKVASDGSQLDTWVTWGALQESTLAWTAACLDEAWVIITPEDAKAANLDISALRADIDALHGTGGDPPPGPGPA
jgi:LAGLIDADG DNA endonuclease family protein